MSGGSKTTQSTNQQQTATTQLPAWMTSAGQELYNKASTTKPVGAYTGEMTAGLSANQQQAGAAAAAGAGAWQPAIGAAGALTGAGASAPASSVSAAGFTPAAAAAGMNPYVQQVQQNTLGEMTRQGQIDRDVLGDSVQGARAYGGTRHAVLEATQARDQAKAKTDYLDSSNAAAYEAARGQFNTDADRSLSAQTTNAGLNETFLSRLLAGGSQFGQIAEATSNLGSRDIANLEGTGATAQQTEQAALGAKYAETLRAGGAELENYKDLMAILQGTPRNVTTSGTSSGTSTSKQDAGLFNQLLGIAQVGASAFSDPRLKKDVGLIERLANGLGIYRFRYLWQRASEPVVIGVMADEVARIAPDALGPVIAGYMTVNYAKIGEMVP